MKRRCREYSASVPRATVGIVKKEIDVLCSTPPSSAAYIQEAVTVPTLIEARLDREMPWMVRCGYEYHGRRCGGHLACLTLRPRLLVIRPGFHLRDGVWQLTSYARKRVEQDKLPKFRQEAQVPRRFEDRVTPAFAAHPPRPETWGVTGTLHNHRAPVSDKPSAAIVCPEPKCRRENSVDVEQLARRCAMILELSEAVQQPQDRDIDLEALWDPNSDDDFVVIFRSHRVH